MSHIIKYNLILDQIITEIYINDQKLLFFIHPTMSTRYLKKKIYENLIKIFQSRSGSAAEAKKFLHMVRRDEAAVEVRSSYAAWKERILFRNVSLRVSQSLYQRSLRSVRQRYKRHSGQTRAER